MDKSTSMKTGRTQVWTKSSSEFVLRTTLLSRRTSRLKPTYIHTRRTNGRILTSKGSGTNKGSVVLWVIKMAAVAC